MNPTVPVLVLIDDGYFGHEALHEELGPGFDVRFAKGPIEAHAAMAELVWPIVLAPRTLEPIPGDIMLADLERHRYRFVGALLLDQGADDGLDRLPDGVQVIVRRPLKPGMLRLHAQAAAAMRARLLEATGDAARLEADLARLRDGLRHDLRGQLQSVIGLASLVLELESPRRPPDDEIIDFVTRILAAGDRLTHFVDVVGDWLNAARRPLEPAVVDLGELVLEVVARERTLAPEATMTVEPADPAALAARVSGDARFLQKALEVLLRRAHGVAKEARVSLTRVAAGWAIAISDVLAKPLSEVQRRKAFLLFEKVAGGDGLELALVHKIAERHGATVTLEPLAEGGHAVVLTLPVAPAVS